MNELFCMRVEGSVSSRRIIKDKFSTWILFFSFCLLSFSCSSLIEVDPPFNTINKDNVFDNNETAISMVNNIYETLSNSNFSLTGDITNLYAFGGLASDELTLYDNSVSFYNMFYANALNENTQIGYWNSTYSLIFNANLAIEGLSSSKSLTNTVQQQLLGEAKFIRAFCYFYLVNLYGGVPLVISVDPLKNAVLPRSDTGIIYTQIIADLKEAEQILSDNFLNGNLVGNSNERVRPSKWAAKAFLARVYLYRKDYLLAKNKASEVINNVSVFSLDTLNGVFLKNSNESIWQLQNINNTQGNTGEGNYFILPSTGPNSSNYPFYLSHYVLESFESGDLRKTKWIDSVIVDNSNVYYYPYKYKSGALTSPGLTTEYETVLRLGEQYLIRSEALAQIGQLQEAQSDLNIIRSRSGLPNISPDVTQSELVDAILHERQVELFTEWGHRWLDLKRTNKLDNVMPAVTQEKGGTWNSNWAYWPISLSELMADPYLIQNPGY